MEKRLDLTLPNAMARLYNYIDNGWTLIYLGASLAVLERR